MLITADLLAYSAVHVSLLGLRMGGEQFGLLSGGYLGGWQFALALVLGLTVTGAYNRGGEWTRFGRIARGVLLASSLVLWGSFWSQDIWIVGSQFLTTVIVVTTIIALERQLMEMVTVRVMAGVRTETALIIGNPEAPKAVGLVNALSDRKHVEIVGWVWYEDEVKDSHGNCSRSPHRRKKCGSTTLSTP